MGSLQWWMLGCLVILLAATSASGGLNAKCYSDTTTSGCAGMESACCCQDVNTLPTEPANALPITTPQGLLTALPISKSTIVRFTDSTAESKSLRDERSGDFLIPSELRLGSALWSHAPPTHPA
jgi:hypothetical protein